MSTSFRRCLCVAVAAIVCSTAADSARAIGTDFTYQGQLINGGSPISGTVDLQFSMWNAASGGIQQGATITRTNVNVTNGLVTQDLDFGAIFAAGANRWIQVAVRSPAGSGVYTTLSPRQALTPTPYAQYAANSPGSGLWELVGSAVTNTNAGFVGINRSAPLTSNEVFGIHATVGAGTYGGMYISTDTGTGLPFYGYNAGTNTCWSYMDGSTGTWSLFNGADRLSVTSGGNVGIGTTSPSNRLTVTAAADTSTIVAIDSGVTAAQSSTLRLNDRGTPFWSLNKNASNDFAIREVGSSADRLYISQGGNVGVGTSSPNSRLEVRDSAAVTSATSSLGSTVTDFDGVGPRVSLRTGSNLALVYESKSQVSPNSGGQVLICSPDGVARGGIQMTGTNQCTVFGTVKSFVVPNPDDASTVIAYASVEGPEAAMYVRGTARLVGGRATVQLPRHFTSMLSSPQTMTVELTSEDLNCRGLAVIRKGAESFDVGELMQGTSNGMFDWEVKAVRSGFEDFKVVRPSYWYATPAGAAPQ